jgi:hypothetical protein
VSGLGAHSASPQGVWLLSAPGGHTERVTLLAALCAQGAPLYARAQDLPALRRAVERPWGEPLGEGGEEGLDALLADLEARAAVITTPWTHAARLIALPALLSVGPFTLCSDDSRIGAPRTLLLHWGAEPLYRVPPASLTLPRDGALACARFELFDEAPVSSTVDALISLRVTLYNAHLHRVAGPWLLTARPA